MEGTDTVISIPQGMLRGTVRKGISQFHGIPYAKPPVGSRRFCMPEAAESWEGIRDARERAAIAPQPVIKGETATGKKQLNCSEDCLTLAVSTPSPEGNYPVVVWFHGGANSFGGGDLESYDGASLARAAEAVVVNLNFRLGALGFLQYPGINEENLSIEDQLLALRWVQKNIRAFGGDPSRVTLMGQSAGGNAIAHILSRKDSEGLFHQIILESPSLGRGNHTRADAFRVAKAVLKQLKLEPAQDLTQNLVPNPTQAPTQKASLLEQVQAVGVDEILDAAAKLPADLQAHFEGMPFKPVMDAWHTPQETIQAAAAEAARRGIRILIGTNRDEIHAFMLKRDEESLKKGAIAQAQRYDDPAKQFAKRAAKLGCPVWKYYLTWQAKDSIYDCCHSLELPFVFGTWHLPVPMLRGASEEEMERLQRIFQHYWRLYIHGETFAEKEWPRYEGAQPQLKCIDNQENPIIPELPCFGNAAAE